MSEPKLLKLLLIQFFATPKSYPAEDYLSLKCFEFLTQKVFQIPI